MKVVRFVIILLLTQVFSHAGGTAYEALRIIGKNNQDFLNHVIEVRGTFGQPQPGVWTILIDDQAARGGVRQMDVSKGHVISEHTPVHAFAGTGSNSVMDFKRLNLDSQGAFTVANQEAAKRNAGFDSIDYLLRSDEQTGAPVWILKLIDVNHVLVGTMTIAADNGAVLNAVGFAGSPNGAVAVAPPPAPVAPTGADAPAPTAVTPTDDDGDTANGNDAPPYGVGHQINKGLHRIGADLQQFFTGKRTWDKKFENEP